jgi:hypothetical protein
VLLRGSSVRRPSANQGRDLAIDYAHADFDARIEERRIDDPQLTAT